ncbi:Octapeptide-repeat protein T2, partial [Ophiophagus hannah]
MTYGKIRDESEGKGRDGKKPRIVLKERRKEGKVEGKKRGREEKRKEGNEKNECRKEIGGKGREEPREGRKEKMNYRFQEGKGQEVRGREFSTWKKSNEQLSKLKHLLLRQSCVSSFKEASILLTTGPAGRRLGEMQLGQGNLAKRQLCMGELCAVLPAPSFSPTHLDQQGRRWPGWCPGSVLSCHRHPGKPSGRGDSAKFGLSNGGVHLAVKRTLVGWGGYSGTSGHDRNPFQDFGCNPIWSRTEARLIAHAPTILCMRLQFCACAEGEITASGKIAMAVFDSHPRICLQPEATISPNFWSSPDLVMNRSVRDPRCHCTLLLRDGCGHGQLDITTGAPSALQAKTGSQAPFSTARASCNSLPAKMELGRVALLNSIFTGRSTSESVLRCFQVAYGPDLSRDGILPVLSGSVEPVALKSSKHRTSSVFAAVWPTHPPGLLPVLYFLLFHPQMLCAAQLRLKKQGKSAFSNAAHPRTALLSSFIYFISFIGFLCCPISQRTLSGSGAHAHKVRVTHNHRTSSYTGWIPLLDLSTLWARSSPRALSICQNISGGKGKRNGEGGRGGRERGREMWEGRKEVTREKRNKESRKAGRKKGRKRERGRRKAGKKGDVERKKGKEEGREEDKRRQEGREEGREMWEGRKAGRKRQRRGGRQEGRKIVGRQERREREGRKRRGE